MNLDAIRGVGRFCWFDLAATDADAALRFYGEAFGWTSTVRAANGGSFITLHAGGQALGSLYQLSPAHQRNGVPSHWTPYVLVDDLAPRVRRVQACGGAVVVPPFLVDGVARIALCVDAAGAVVGLWEDVAPAPGAVVDA